MNPMPGHEAALWTAELGPRYNGPTLRTQLRAAVQADPRPQAQIARAAGMDRSELNRLLRESPARDATLSTWEQVAAALGLRVALVPAVPPHRVRLAKCGACNSCIQGASCEDPVEVDG